MNIIDDYTRRIEILAYCLSVNDVEFSDLMNKFKASDSTIHRDLLAIREKGISIHSRKQKIKFEGLVDRLKLIELCKDYLQLKLESDLFTRQITELSKITDNFFVYLVQITQAITESKVIKIKYKKADSTIIEARVNPVKLQIASEFDWQLFAAKEGEDKLKTFYLSRILGIEVQKCYFDTASQPELKQEVYDLTLKFDSDIQNEVLDKIWFENRAIELDSENNIILKTKQPITNRLAGWCLTWWGKMEIVEPLELKTYIAEMIAAFNAKNKT